MIPRALLRVFLVVLVAADGRYMVNGNNVKSFNELLARTDKIIHMRRKERGQKK